jgi:hypothetical protein
MLKKVEFLPKEHLIKKYVEITGEDYAKAEAIMEREGIEAIADVVEEHLLMKALREREI